MIKVKMKVTMSGRKGVFPCGSIREMEDAKAKHLISKGFAELLEIVEEPKKEAPNNNGNTKVSNKNTTSKRANKSKRGKKPSKG